MPIIAATPPVPVPIVSSFDYVAIDAQRRRIYAAHTGSRSLLIVDADSGNVVGQVRVGPLHGVAVDPLNGHVYTGDGEAQTISEIDPESLKVVRTATVEGTVDAVAYDPGNRHIYADEGDGKRVFVIDANKMRSLGSIVLPGHKPEYLVVDPETHDLYQNISDRSVIAVIDGTTLEITRLIGTPEISANHPLQYDAAYHHLLVGGQNGQLAAYQTDGKLVGKTAIQPSVDQCDLDPLTHDIACAGSGMISILHDNVAGAPTLIAQGPISRAAHTLAIDPKTGRVWVVWAESTGDFVQSFVVTP